MGTTLISACLLGQPCRYDGQAKAHDGVKAEANRLRESNHDVVAVCPEELGGLGTPRPAAELRSGDGHAVLHGTARVCRADDNQDVTEAFVTGARRALALAPHANQAILKARSPSCGCGLTHIDGAVRPGDGVFAALLKSNGVAVQTDEEWRD